MKQRLLNTTNKYFKLLLVCSFGLFLILLVWVLYFKINNTKSLIGNYNTIKHNCGDSIWERIKYAFLPFKNIAKYSTKKDFILNTIAFVPFGIYLPLLFKNHTHLKGLACCFFVSLAIETTQFITMMGTGTIIDLIANTSGYFIGAILFIIFKPLLKKKIFVTAVNILIITIALPIAIYGVVNTLNSLHLYTVAFN